MNEKKENEVIELLWSISEKLDKIVSALAELNPPPNTLPPDGAD